MKNARMMLLAVVAMVLGLTACDKEKPVDKVSLTATSTTQQTRVSGEADNVWDGDETIGLYADKLGADNVQFVIDEQAGGTSVKFVATGEGIEIPAGEEKYAVKAYYPYAAAQVFDLAEMGAEPILYATSEVSHVAPNATLNFKHKLGKLNVIVTVEEEIEGAEPVVTLKDVRTEATLDIETGDVTAGEVTGDIVLTKDGENTFHTFLLPDTEEVEYTIAITYGDKSYTLTRNIQIKEAMRKTLKVNLKKDVTEPSEIIDVDEGRIEGTEEDGDEINIGDLEPEEGAETEEPGEGEGGETEEPGEGGETEEPEAPVLVFPGSDFEDWNAFLASLNSKGFSLAEQTDDGMKGKALHITGTAPSRNGYVFTAVAGGVDIPADATKIVLYLNGTVVDKALSFNVHTDSGLKCFNINEVGSLGTEEITLTPQSQNSYDGSIDTQGQWVKVTLDISELTLVTSDDLFSIKYGKTGVYDLKVDEIHFE